MHVAMAGDHAGRPFMDPLARWLEGSGTVFVGPLTETPSTIHWPPKRCAGRSAVVVRAGHTALRQRWCHGRGQQDAAHTRIIHENIYTAHQMVEHDAVNVITPELVHWAWNQPEIVAAYLKAEFTGEGITAVVSARSSALRGKHEHV